MDLNDISDLSLRKEVNRMHHTLPTSTVQQCYDALQQTNGNYDNAVYMLLGWSPEKPQHFKEDIRTPACEESHMDSKQVQDQQRKRASLLIRLAWRIEDAITDINWKHVAFKICAFTYLAFMMWITWFILPLPGHWPEWVIVQSDKVPVVYQDFSNYFGQFEGFAECGIRARDLYQLPPRTIDDRLDADFFCPNRMALLQALSDGGRIGFDAPYQPKGCAYRWYSVDEICFILERFDSIVFVGDSSLQEIYNGFNILLRQNLAAGSLRSWDMDDKTRDQCRCNSQFTTEACAKYFVTSSEEVAHNTPSFGTPSFCQRTPHAILRIDGSPAPTEIIKNFKEMVPKAPRSKYRPIPIIHSLTPTTFSQQVANHSLLEFLRYADESQRKTPMLWIGPTAPGHNGAKDRQDTTEIWTYDEEMAKTARTNDIEVLKMYNMTAQANSYQGGTFGERVAITQAMMGVFFNKLKYMEGGLAAAGAGLAIFQAVFNDTTPS